MKFYLKMINRVEYGKNNHKSIKNISNKSIYGGKFCLVWPVVEQLTMLCFDLLLQNE